MKIRELTTGSEEVVAKVKNVNKGTTQAGSPYLSFLIQDESASINCKYWESEGIEVKTGNVYTFIGEIGEYNGRNQFIVTSLEQVTDEEIINSFYKSAPLEIDVVKTGVLEYVNKIEEDNVRLIVKEILSRYDKEYFTYPAATQNHHAYLTGLGYHTLTMLKLSDSLLETYQYLDKSLLYAGIILHDFAKVIELSEARAPEYTLEGKLVGHLVIGSNLIAEVAKELNIDSEAVLLLQHLVLSHHGRKEWGSPQRPQIAEAEALHFIDNIDSKFESLRLEFENTSTGTWTKRIPVLDGRAFYKHK